MLLEISCRGDSDGRNKLGYCYQYGARKDKKAFQCYLKSGGDSSGQYNLAVCYENVVKDVEKAFNEGQNNVAYCYENGVGIEKDEEKALQGSIKTVEGGNKLSLSTFEYYH
ncbi:hypothetical protein Glove_396g74 [Diversispora epigaea]|uniref:Uncharacterized protein n=1 Tax=Diversispora epigaea TaxID=1348612 RepID=A0A397H135_9GLOM|nr:hypothetical protein Glove_396g74 [Diversispora epigaea]